MPLEKARAAYPRRRRLSSSVRTMPGSSPRCFLVVRQDREAGCIQRHAGLLLRELLRTGRGLQVDQVRVDRIHVGHAQEIVPAGHAVREQRTLEHDALERLVYDRLHWAQVRRDRAMLIRMTQHAVAEEQRPAALEGVRRDSRLLPGWRWCRLQRWQLGRNGHGAPAQLEREDSPP